MKTGSWTERALNEYDEKKRQVVLGALDDQRNPICSGCIDDEGVPEEVTTIIAVTGEWCVLCENVVCRKTPGGWRRKNGIEIMGEAVNDNT